MYCQLVVEVVVEQEVVLLQDLQIEVVEVGHPEE
jgi:hypothetical protein